MIKCIAIIVSDDCALNYLNVDYFTLWRAISMLAAKIWVVSIYNTVINLTQFF